MEIPITTLQAMLTNAATLGAMSAVKRLDPNSPFYYSKCQIEAAFAAVRCKDLL